MEPLIHPVSKTVLDLLIKDLPQSLMITGPVGVGLGTIASYIAGIVGDTVLIVQPEKDEKVDLAKGVISVDSIRRLYSQTKSIQTGKLVIVIDYAERMGHQAQNAFLKLLEEPRTGIHFILATHTPLSLLPTVRSRVQLLDLKPLTRSQTDAFIYKLPLIDDTKRSQLLFMADGLPAELHRLAHDETYFNDQIAIVRDARDLLQASTYRKLVIAQKYRDNREGALRLLNDAMAILKKSISDHPTSELISQIEGLLMAYQKIKSNGNIRLCLARLVI